MGLLEVLTVVFVVLKLTGVISWSWGVVFLPLIVSLAINLVFYTELEEIKARQKHGWITIQGHNGVIVDEKGDKGGKK